MRRLAIIGASGHGKVIVDIAKRIGYCEIVFLTMMKASMNVEVIR